MYRTIVEAVLAHAKTNSDKTAIGFKEKTISYKELAVQMKLAAYLLKEEYGIVAGDR